jgi:hypothetical protein
MAESDGHIFMPSHRLGTIGSQEAIPPGKIKPKVAIGLSNNYRMVDPVHLRGDDEKAQDPIDSTREANIAVIEHTGSVQEDFKNQNCQEGNP